MSNWLWVPSATCVAGAVYLAARGVSGWGWFLLVAFFVAPSTPGVTFCSHPELHEGARMEVSDD